jgi:hypothetical protein
MLSKGIGFRFLLSSRSGRNTLEKAFLISRPYSWIERLIIDLMVEKFLLTELVVNPLSRR